MSYYANIATTFVPEKSLHMEDSRLVLQFNEASILWFHTKPPFPVTFVNGATQTSSHCASAIVQGATIVQALSVALFCGHAYWEQAHFTGIFPV